MSEEIIDYGQEPEFTPPTTRAQAYRMVEALDPIKIISRDKRALAYKRLLQFIDILIPE